MGRTYSRRREVHEGRKLCAHRKSNCLIVTQKEVMSCTGGKKLEDLCIDGNQAEIEFVLGILPPVIGPRSKFSRKIHTDMFNSWQFKSVSSRDNMNEMILCTMPWRISCSPFCRG